MITEWKVPQCFLEGIPIGNQRSAEAQGWIGHAVRERERTRSVVGHSQRVADEDCNQ